MAAGRVWLGDYPEGRDDGMVLRRVLGRGQGGGVRDLAAERVFQTGVLERAV